MNSNWPSTLTEAVDRLMSTLTPDELNAIRHTPEEELISLHFSLGMRIRNTFGLWQGNDDLLHSCCAHVNDPWLRESVLHDPERPSGRMVEALWERLQSSKQ
jgi:hypothetical protein